MPRTSRLTVFWIQPSRSIAERPEERRKQAAHQGRGENFGEGHGVEIPAHDALFFPQVEVCRDAAVKRLQHVADQFLAQGRLPPSFADQRARHALAAFQRFVVNPCEAQQVLGRIAAERLRGTRRGRETPPQSPAPPRLTVSASIRNAGTASPRCNPPARRSRGWSPHRCPCRRIPPAPRRSAAGACLVRRVPGFCGCCAHAGKFCK